MEAQITDVTTYLWLFAKLIIGQHRHWIHFKSTGMNGIGNVTIHLDLCRSFLILKWVYLSIFKSNRQSRQRNIVPILTPFLLPFQIIFYFIFNCIFNSTSHLFCVSYEWHINKYWWHYGFRAEWWIYWFYNDVKYIYFF